jgi:outer membrane protein assembly factor BamB
MKTMFKTLSLIFTILAISIQVFGGGGKAIIKKTGISKGICVLGGISKESFVIDLVKNSDLIVYVQVETDEDVQRIRKAAESEGLYGKRIYVEKGDLKRIFVPDGFADLFIGPGSFKKEEALRVINPLGKAVLWKKIFNKKYPDNIDEWTHPYHGPDSNPISKDKLALYPFRTKFLAKPYYSPMPSNTVAAAGRVFKAFGQIAFKTREWEWVNKLIALNGYNGTMLWSKDLPPGFMVDRNNMIATKDILYFGDDKSCKLYDTATGKVINEIKSPNPAMPQWMWIALQNKKLFALLGKTDFQAKPHKSISSRAGWNWGNLKSGFKTRTPDAYNFSWGYGQTFAAFDEKTKKLLWKYVADNRIDSRALCMNSTKIFLFSQQKYLLCLDAETGQELWRQDSQEFLSALEPHTPKQDHYNGFWTENYMKCTEDAVYFAGPQTPKLLAIDANNGKILWKYDKSGNFKLVLTKDAVYAMGSASGPGSPKSYKFDPLTGKILEKLKLNRQNCTRATANTEKIFVRGLGTKMIDMKTGKINHISAFRPGCMDGIVVSGGHFYAGPWACDCNVSLVGVIGLEPAGKFRPGKKANGKERLEVTGKLSSKSKKAPTDWPTYRATNNCSSGIPVTIPEKIDMAWEYKLSNNSIPTAPVSVKGIVYIGDSSGAVHAIDIMSGKYKWKFLTGGAIDFPPSIWKGRAYVGSADGWIYCLNAKNGKQLWRFRAAPEERKIPVYGQLRSAWPVASGVRIHNGVAYAAAGITNYDGTYVYALDALTGKIIWQNSKSHDLKPNKAEKGGASVQGHLLIHDNRLYLASGSAFSPMSYDLKTGTTLKEPIPNFNYHNTQSFRGDQLSLVNGEVKTFGHIKYGHEHDLDNIYFWWDPELLAWLDDIIVFEAGKGWSCKIGCASINEKIRKKTTKVIWETRINAKRDLALALGKNAAIVLSFQRHHGKIDPAKYFITALNIKNGKTLWKKDLPGPAVHWSLALGQSGQILISLRNGKIICFK